LITSEFEVLASSLRFMAASAFVSDERVLNVGIGAAQLRLANLVQGDWLSGASQVAYQGGIDHLMRAVPFDDLPGTSRLVWVQFVDPVYRDRADQDTEGIVKFSLSSTTQLGSSGSWMLGRSGRRAGKCSLRKYSKWRRPGWLRARAGRRVWRVHRQRLLPRLAAGRAWRGGWRNPARARCSHRA
jgi:hypothetical protein